MQTATAASTSYRRGWSRIWGKPRGAMLMLPAEATHALISLQPFRISCILPAKTRTIQADFYKNENPVSFSLRTPQLLIQQHINLQPSGCGDSTPCNCQGCYPAPHPAICYCKDCLPHKRRSRGDYYKYYTGHFKLYAVELTDTRIYGVPYRAANVYPQGNICFGQQRFPRNLRQANAQLWGTPFNNDFGDHNVSHPNCDNKKHFNNYQHFAQGRHSRTRPACRAMIKHRCNCYIENQKGTHKPDCGCLLNCGCRCICPCCTSTCQCICQCQCCRNTCNCDCRCDLNNLFIYRLQNYHPNNPRQSDITNTILGENVQTYGFLSTTKQADAVFISFDDDLVKNNKTQHTRGGKAVVGFARRKEKHWTVDLGSTHSLELVDREVYIP